MCFSTANSFEVGIKRTIQIFSFLRKLVIHTLMYKIKHIVASHLYTSRKLKRLPFDNTIWNTNSHCLHLFNFRCQAPMYICICTYTNYMVCMLHINANTKYSYNWLRQKTHCSGEWDAKFLCSYTIDLRNINPVNLLCLGNIPNGCYAFKCAL